MIQNLAVYPTEQSVLVHEHADGCYTTSTFLLAYTLLELPFTLASSLLFGVLAAFAIRAKETVTFCFVAALNCFCIVTTGESIGVIFCALVGQSQGLSVNLMSTVISISVTMTGLFSLNMAAWLKALNYLSPLKYSVGNLAVWMLRGQKFTCTTEQMVGDRCQIETGEQVLGLYGLDHEPGVQLAALVACTLVYRLLAFVVLWAVKR
jgi:ABC-type multidrug transport system permease subunit